MTAANPSEDRPDDHEIQLAHMAYLGKLCEEGKILLNGPVKAIDNPRIRGMSIYSVGPEEAKELAMQDPGVLAGWFDVEVDGWLVRARPVTIGNRVDLEVEV